jgi:hypothetical protein
MSAGTIEPDSTDRAQLALAKLENAADYISSQRVIEHLREAFREAVIISGAEWLCAEDACLVAGRISRQTLNKAAADGVINRKFIGDKPMFERASINAAISSGKLE